MKSRHELPDCFPVARTRLSQFDQNHVSKISKSLERLNAYGQITLHFIPFELLCYGVIYVRMTDYKCLNTCVQNYSIVKTPTTSE